MCKFLNILHVQSTQFLCTLIELKLAIQWTENLFNCSSNFLWYWECSVQIAHVKGIQKSHIWTHTDRHIYNCPNFKEQGRRNFICWIKMSESAGEYSGSQPANNDVCCTYFLLWMVDFRVYGYQLWIKWNRPEIYAATWSRFWIQIPICDTAKSPSVHED